MAVVNVKKMLGEWLEEAIVEKIERAQNLIKRAKIREALYVRVSQDKQGENYSIPSWLETL